MRIGTIFTGGTIGSQIDRSGYIVTGQAAPFVLLEMYKTQFEGNTEFVVKEPYRILSENLQAANLENLIICIEETLKNENLDGLIVTHGTDTLQYTSAILGYVFGDSQIPIVLVSSNYVLTDARANGLTNFRYAVEYIRICIEKKSKDKKYGRGVFVSYCNQGGIPTIHRATRLQPPITLSDDVFSVGNSWFGRFENDSYVGNTAYSTKSGVSSIRELMDCQMKNASNNDLAGTQRSHQDDAVKIRLTGQTKAIMRIVPYVGMTYPEIMEDTKVILHESFHSGTIGVNENLKNFAEQAREKQIPFYLTGLSQREKCYETVRAYEELGIVPLAESAVISQYCKLWLAVSNGMDIKNIMSQPVAEDVLI